MLKAVVMLLVLANALFLAWSQGALANMGLGRWATPGSTQEPERLGRQIQPERLRLETEALVAPGAPTPVSSQAASPAPDPAELRCLQAGPYTEAQAPKLRDAMAKALPDGGWNLESSTQPARWIVYLGKLAGPDSLAAKKAELRLLKVEFRDVNNPSLQPGLALGTFASEAAAEQAMRDLGKLAVKGARALAERPETTEFTLKLPQASESMAKRVTAQADALAGKPLQPCP